MSRTAHLLPPQHTCPGWPWTWPGWPWVGMCYHPNRRGARRGPRLLWNVVTSLIAVVVLVGAAGRLKAYGLPGPAQGEPSLVALAGPRQAGEPSAGQGEQGAPAGESKEEAGGARKEIFLWVNFLIIVGGFWYLGKKYLGPFLLARAQAIREDMERSSNALQDAAQRLSGVEDKLKRLDEEIGSLRHSALQEADGERARIEESAKADARKIALAAEQEIAAAAKVARQELKVYAAELAVSLAEKKIQETISAQADKGIFRSFLQDLSNNSGNGNRTRTS